uniref:U3 small nucleolar RNA-associated protein 14 homolog A n=1 Tax=Schistocephalus solidus TaxID=70667 RepID=A0A0X3NUR9_SCHSO
MANLPALPDASVWGLLKLKAGNKNKQAQKLEQIQKESAPLETPDVIKTTRNKRRLQYNLIRQQLDLWKGPVHKNRLTDQLIFPLPNNAVQFSTSKEAREEKHMKEIEAASLDTSDIRGLLFSALYKNNATVPSDLDKEQAADLELARKMCIKASDQMKRRLREVAALRKAKIQNRIKSKNYHRRMKRRSMKEFEKEIVLLRQNNPKAFAERLLEVEKSRARERASLRHKRGGKFAKLQRIRAKYDKEAREAVAQMHDRGIELTRRRVAGNDDDDDSDAMSLADLSSEEEDASENEVSDASDMEEDHLPAVPPHLVGWWAKVEEQKTPEKPAPQVSTLLSTLASDDLLSRTEKKGTGEVSSATADLDPSDEQFFSALQEACGEDSALTKQFEKEKHEIEEEEAPKDVDPFIPGWNRWTGPGTEAQDEVLRKRFLVKAPKRKRKDARRTKVIIRERVNTDLKKHLVKRIPFPYSTPEQFEAAIEQPVSREWTTESAHRELTKPKVILKAGRVIKPIDKSCAILREKDVLRLKTGKRNV